MRNKLHENLGRGRSRNLDFHHLGSSNLALGAEIYVAASHTQLLYGSSTYWAVLLFHVWTHSWRVAAWMVIEVIELVFSLEPDSLLQHTLYCII